MKDSASVWNYSNTVPKVDLTNPDEMIRANGAAEAAQTDRLKADYMRRTMNWSRSSSS